MAVPVDDLANLAVLAPPADQATEQGRYGDAAFARGRRTFVRHACPHGPRSAACAPRAGDASAFFRRNYVYTPSFVSAPQIFGKPPGQPSLLPPVTSFFYDPFDPPAARQ